MLKTLTRWKKEREEWDVWGKNGREIKKHDIKKWKALKWKTNGWYEEYKKKIKKKIKQ